MVSLHFVTLVAVLSLAPPAPHTNYALTHAEQAQVSTAMRSSSIEYFDTAAQAAYGAALRYGRLSEQEIGAVIFMDIVDGHAKYTFGPLIVGETDNTTGYAEIAYDATDPGAHARILGVWHEHPIGDHVNTLAGHADTIATTHQAVWTSVQENLYVQYWDDDASRVYADASVVCNGCVP
jgi:hypothetical protein